MWPCSNLAGHWLHSGNGQCSTRLDGRGSVRGLSGRRIGDVGGPRAGQGMNLEEYCCWRHGLQCRRRRRYVR